MLNSLVLRILKPPHSLTEQIVSQLTHGLPGERTWQTSEKSNDNPKIDLYFSNLI